MKKQLKFCKDCKWHDNGECDHPKNMVSLDPFRLHSEVNFSEFLVTGNKECLNRKEPCFRGESCSQLRMGSWPSPDCRKSGRWFEPKETT